MVREVAVASGDGKVQFWHAATGRQLFTLADSGGPGQRALDIAFSPDGEWFAACESTGELRLWHGPRE